MLTVFHHKGFFVSFLLMTSSMTAWASTISDATQQAAPVGCIVSTETGQRYCLPVGQRSGYSLPDWIVGKEVYVETEPGAKVLLSDWDDLSYNRIGEFVGTLEPRWLRNVTAWSGETIDFDKPRSMRVVDTSEPLGCIVSVADKRRFCLPRGKPAAARGPISVRLPSWISGKEVYVDAAEGTQVVLSDREDFYEHRVAQFSGNVGPSMLKGVLAWNGKKVDFDKPLSIRVVYSNLKYDYVFPHGIEKYVAGTKVFSPRVNVVYTCNPDQAAGFCKQWSESSNEYEPGVGQAWEQAWTGIKRKW